MTDSQLRWSIIGSLLIGVAISMYIDFGLGINEPLYNMLPLNFFFFTTGLIALLTGKLFMGRALLKTEGYAARFIGLLLIGLAVASVFVFGSYFQSNNVWPFRKIY